MAGRNHSDSIIPKTSGEPGLWPDRWKPISSINSAVALSTSPVSPAITSTGLAAGADLSVGQTDYASFKTDTGSLKPGTYTLGLNLTYGNGTQFSRVSDPGRQLMRWLFIGVLVAAAISTATTGCGATSGAASPSASLSPKVATAYVDAQVRALCLVQSKAYPTQKALEAAYVQAEHSAKLTAREFAQAHAATLHDLALRERISEQVAATCAKHK